MPRPQQTNMERKLAHSNIRSNGSIRNTTRSTTAPVRRDQTFNSTTTCNESDCTFKCISNSLCTKCHRMATDHERTFSPGMETGPTNSDARKGNEIQECPNMEHHNNQNYSWTVENFGQSAIKKDMATTGKPKKQQRKSRLYEKLRNYTSTRDASCPIRSGYSVRAFSIEPESLTLIFCIYFTWIGILYRTVTRTSLYRGIFKRNPHENQCH
jgi:hypothetical protein